MRGVKANLFIMAFVFIPLALGAWVVQTKIANNVRAEVGRSLTTVRDTTHLAVKTWFRDQTAVAAVWADAPIIRELAVRLLALRPHQSALLDSPAQQELRDWFRRMQTATRYRGYFIVGTNHINLASSRDQNVGTENLLLGQPEFLASAWAGRSVISLPIRSDVPLNDSHGRLVSGLPSMFVAAPIHNESGEVIAIFMFRLDPEEGFTNTLKQGRIGKTGETYAFDGEGRLISQSRFDDQLHESGLIPEGERGILNIQLRDPGVNLVAGEKATEPRSQLPLTHMAKSAIRAETGIDLNGHRDYRGVPVVCAWTWDTELGLGVTTELDVHEAYQTLRATRWTIVTLTVFVFFLLVALTVIYTLFQQRRMAEEELRRAATVFDNTGEGIIVTNAETDIVLVNNAFTAITGYKSEDVLGKKPGFQQSGRHDSAFYQVMWDILNRDGQWRGEIWNRRKNGDIYPAWENINAVKDEHGHITNYVAIFSDISVLKESEARMAELAHHDTLTGLPNRLRFISNLAQAIESAKRHKHKVALMFLDLDRFKYINDTLGHNVGDELLKTIAGRLKSCVRAEDTVARLGGDEFTVVLTEVAHAEDAGLIADKIVKVVCKPVTVGGKMIDTSASVGISIYPDDAVEGEGMVKAADTAMYHAKAMGKNCFQYFTADLAARTFEHARIEKQLRKALEDKEFELYYQPQVSLVDGKIAGVEALIRWNHPEHGKLLPDEFIQVADDSDLIDAISEWVLRTALSDSKKWSKEGSMGPRISVNITGRQITREQSVKRILRILDELAPEPSKLQFELEITETALEDTERTINLINRLKNRGVMFAIDDFGAGHSSLRRLKQLPVDTLKIDRSFIRDIADQGDDKAIAAAIIAMAHSLGMRVIGEGVETESQLEVLRALDCDEIQGFYFSKPVPTGEIASLLEKSFH